MCDYVAFLKIKERQLIKLYVPMKQKCIFLMLFALSIFSGGSAQNIKEQNFEVTSAKKGDVNGDGGVTMSDANMIVNAFLSGENLEGADLNGDGDVTMSDANQAVNIFLRGADTEEGMENGHEYVDLGLSVKWAKCNVGAQHPQDYGDYFAWGETEPKEDYSSAAYKWKENGLLTKYCVNSYSGTVDNRTTLELDDDAATANWQGAWRMPTLTELEELCDSCLWVWTSSYNDTDVKGYIVFKAKDKADRGKKVYMNMAWDTPTSATYSLSDNHIFLPAAGWYEGMRNEATGSNGCYLTATLSQNNDVCYLKFGSGYVYDDSYCNRYYGRTVRPVCP